MDATQFLTRDEISRVLVDLKGCPSERRLSHYGGRCKRTQSARMNLAIFRLSCCCGLRSMEISGLNISDVITGGDKPCIRIRAAITKGKNGKRRGRIVPLWWDRGTLDDLKRHKEERVAQGAEKEDSFVCKTLSEHKGLRIPIHNLRRRWVSAIRVLGEDRVSQLTIHCGRHSFISHALHAGHSLAAVRDAAGHATICTTNVYLHHVEGDEIQDVFDQGDRPLIDRLQAEALRKAIRDSGYEVFECRMCGRPMVAITERQAECFTCTGLKRGVV